IVACDYFFIPPRMAFAWTDTRKTLTFVAMLVVGAVIGGLSERLRHQERAARRTAFSTKALYDLNVELFGGRDAAQLAAITARHLERLFESRVLVLLRGADGHLGSPLALLTGDEASLMARAWERAEFGVSAGRDGYRIWLPVVGLRETLGVIGLEIA